MPIWTSLIRLLRRRIVLGLIFGLSLTYCAVSLLRQEGKSISFENDFEDIDDNTFLNENEDNSDEQVSMKSSLWEMDVLDDNIVDSLEPIGGQENNNDSSIHCRNSIQGKVLIVDEKGYVCLRRDILASGCCNPELPKNSQDDQLAISKKREKFSCETCNSQGCCAIYEYCVSCCLHPGKHRVKSKKSSDNREIKAQRGEDVLKNRLRGLDRFQFCLAACRTSSASVRHENTYKNPHSKHCYNPYTLNSHRRSQRDLESINSNNNNVFTSSSD
ncbi:SREBP regulating gene protein [Leptopilina boulardi]|uniref:SREBP regulating gene protein n=1 Tax=Leptopilina boulardi TaxID=63433 RepID=UPI0021F52988|nr:SREBP regulating gene protein [Leptopilina boulardi]